MTQFNVKYWAIKKWQWIVDNWNYDIGFIYNRQNLIKDIPRLNDFLNSCSFCELNKINISKIEIGVNCKKCKLHDILYKITKTASGCCEEYNNWRIYCSHVSKNKRKAKYWAKKMLERIKKVKRVRDTCE